MLLNKKYFLKILINGCDDVIEWNYDHGICVQLWLMYKFNSNLMLTL